MHELRTWATGMDPVMPFAENRVQSGLRSLSFISRLLIPLCALAPPALNMPAKTFIQ